MPYGYDFKQRPSLHGAPDDNDMPRDGIRSLIRDLLELAELQVVLLRIDSAAATRLLTRTLVLAVVGACLILAVMPVLLLAFADWIHEATTWSLATSQAVVASGGLVIAIIVLLLARRGFRASLSSYRRSTSELSRNVEWLKRTLGERSQ